MNSVPCKYESDTTRAVRSGQSSPALIQHQQTCADCRETIQVAEALHHDACRLNASFTLPPAAMVWAAAERRRRASSLQQAARIFTILKIAGLAYASIFALWGLHVLAGHASLVVQVLDGKSLSATLKGTAFAAMLVMSGLWYALLPEKRQSN